MRVLRIAIWSISVALLLAFNWIGSIHQPHKQMAYPINDDSIRVFPRNEFDGARNHKILTSSQQTVKTDSSEVQVVISAWYKNDQIRYYPRVNLYIIISALLIQLILWLFTKLSRRRA